MTDGDRAEPWVDLLRRLTAACPVAAADGDLDEGFTGAGDVDVVAPVSEWPAVAAEFRAWSDERALSPVVTCRHRDGVLILVALGEGQTFWELEVRARRYFRGGHLFSAEDLVPLMGEDPRGFRRVAPGAGGLIKLLPNGLAPGGRLKWKREKADRVFARLRDDPAGAAAAVRLYGSAGGAVVRLSGAAAEGRWDRGAALLVEGWALLRALRRPGVLVGRGVARLTDRPCLVQRAVAGGRRRPVDTSSWLELVARDHDVHRPGT